MNAPAPARLLLRDTPHSARRSKGEEREMCRGARLPRFAGSSAPASLPGADRLCAHLGSGNAHDAIARRPRDLGRPAGGKIDGTVHHRGATASRRLTPLEDSELGPCPATRSQQRSNDVAPRAANARGRSHRARAAPRRYPLRTAHVRTETQWARLDLCASAAAAGSAAARGANA
ncbi:hypothetical protein VTO73DRAFT_3846 [Trametes versicolor]